MIIRNHTIEASGAPAAGCCSWCCARGDRQPRLQVQQLIRVKLAYRLIRVRCQGREASRAAPRHPRASPQTRSNRDAGDSDPVLFARPVRARRLARDASRSDSRPGTGLFQDVHVARVAQRRARSPAARGIRSAHKRHTTERNSKQTPQITQSLGCSTISFGRRDGRRDGCRSFMTACCSLHSSGAISLP